MGQLQKMDVSLLFLLILAVNSSIVYATKEIKSQINTKKLINYLPDRFLSMTVDPFTIIAAGPLSDESLKMAKSLSPSIIRIGGKGTNILKFGKEFLVDENTISESQWDSVNKFIKDAGLDFILSLNPSNRVNGVWDSENSLKLISYSEKEGYDIAWQLGYDIKSTNASGVDVGRDLVRLRNILDKFPKYSKNAVFGPDLTSSKPNCEMLFLRNMMQYAGTMVPSLLMQPEFNDNFEDPEAKIRALMNDLDTFVWKKDDKSGNEGTKKPLWIAEPEPSSGTFHDSMMLVKRLGAAAKLGCQVFLRQPGPVALKMPTAEFWTSILFKNLVGRGVLETRLFSNNSSGINMYSHCTPVVSREKTVLDTDWNYEKAAVTVFGANESPEDVKITLEASNKDEEIHMYVLTSGKQMDKHEYPEPTLLNGQKITMSPTGELPFFSPKVLKTDESNDLTIPPMSIFFLVLPNVKVRACENSPLITQAKDGQELIKRIQLLTSDKEKTEDLEKTMYEMIRPTVYVRFNKRQVPNYNGPIMKRLDERSILNRLPRRLSELHRRRDGTTLQDDAPVKYITYNDNSWLHKLKETMSNIGTTERKVTETGNQEISKTKLEKYAPLASAIIGNDGNMDNDKAASRLKRSSTVNPNEDEKKSLEIANLPEKVFNTLKQVQVTFTNPNVMSEQSDLKPKKLNVRQIDVKNLDSPITESLEDIPVERMLTEVTSSEEVEKELSEEESELIGAKAILKDDEHSDEVIEDDLNATEGVPTILPQHIQKINLNEEKLIEPKKTVAPVIASPKEKLINKILSDIITKENNEQPPIVTDIVVDERHPEDKAGNLEENADKEMTIQAIAKAVQNEMDPIKSPSEIQPTLASTSGPISLEEEIANAGKTVETSKVLRQAVAPNLMESKDVEKQHTIIEGLPNHGKVGTENDKNSTETKNNWLKIPMISKDLTLLPENILEESKGRLEEIKERLKETSDMLRATLTDKDLNENLWNTIKKREEELRNIFKKFDKRETNFSPYEGTRGIHFITSKPINDEMLSYGYDRIKPRPRRRLSQKMEKTENYYDNPYLRSHQYLTPAQTPVETTNYGYEKSLYELPKAENQFLFPLDSKTQGIVYNNKIYPAKLFGVVDVPGQQATDINYKSKIEQPYFDNKHVKPENERYSQDYVEDMDYPSEYYPSDQTKKLANSFIQKDLTESQQPYIPVVILSQKDKHFPRMKSERVQTTSTIHARKRRNALFDPASINNIKERFRMNSKKFENNDMNTDEKLYKSITNDIDPNERTDSHETDIGVCDEVGTSKESVIVEHATAQKFKDEKHEKSKNDEEGGTFFTIITDKFKNLIGYVHRIFNFDKD